MFADVFVDMKVDVYLAVIVHCHILFMRCIVSSRLEEGKDEVIAASLSHVVARIRRHLEGPLRTQRMDSEN